MELICDFYHIYHCFESWHINWFFCNIISRKTYNQMYMETWAFWQNLIYSLLFLLLTLFLTTCNIPFCIIESKSRHPACFVWMDWTSIVKWEKVEKAHKVTPWKRKTSLRKLHLCMVFIGSNALILDSKYCLYLSLLWLFL